LVCADGKLRAAQFDRWYAPRQNEPDAVWMVCAPCNRALEDPHFNASVPSSFYSYQRAVWAVLAEIQQEFFKPDKRRCPER